MVFNLNSLSTEEIIILEKYVKGKLTKSSKDVDKLFEDLKNGKLKDRNVEIDALDFIQDGLSEVVEDWYRTKNNKPKENEVEKVTITPNKEVRKKESEQEDIGRLEKMICAPNTRIGRFLITDKRKQITLQEGFEILKKQGKLESLLYYLADLETRKDLFKFVSHDLEHTKRVLINADLLMSLKGDISERDRNIILTAIKYHDSGRINDYEDRSHGKRAAENITDELKGYDQEEQELIKFIITEHCKSTGENEVAISLLDKPEGEKIRYRKFLNIMKDADRLDRVRFPEISQLMTDSLDPNRLKNEEAKGLIKFAVGLLEKNETLFKTKSDDKTLEHLFKRTKIFAEGEEGEKLYNTVEKILSENGYPKRSSKINFRKIQKPEQKFIKDGYLYVFRGSRKGQKSGFYSYQYGTEKQNVSQYLKAHPSVSAEDLANKQSLKGKERFISTTSLMTALGFSKFSKKDNIAGSIYIIKIKPEDAYKTFTPMQDFLKMTEKKAGENEGKDEREYLIPDYIKPEEIVKEFDCRDLNGIYEFLRKDVGLNISLEDIGIDKDLLENPDLLERILDDLCRGNEIINKGLYWGNSDGVRNEVANLGLELLTELMKKPEGSKLLNELMSALMTGKLPGDDSEIR